MRAGRYDSVVVGSGIAGLYAALRLSRLGTVAVVTKAGMEESNTRYAQGGIAAAWFPGDSPALHLADTMKAGAGLADESAVKVLCEAAPDRIAALLAYAVPFDRKADGSLSGGLEAAHSRARILHAGGDATGAGIEHSLAVAVRAAGIAVLEHTRATDLLDGGIALANGTTIHAPAVVLASGGAGQVYRYTTNPPLATGDGVAAAYRAGAELMDLEFFQFHPTALAMGDDRFLISEAVRGEGGVLLDARRQRFTDELAPRDVVARAIADRMALQEGAPVVLDVRSLGAERLAARFPSIDRHLRALGLDWSKEPVPVTPAAHYWMGGVRTNTWGETSRPGLYACGEAAATGVHGANRLASNSLLEGLVFAGRIADRLASGDRFEGPARARTVRVSRPTGAANPHRTEVQQAMWEGAGLLRDRAGLERAVKELSQWQGATPEDESLITVGHLIAETALLREESRGAHARSDFPDTDPGWAHHLVVTS